MKSRCFEMSEVELYRVKILEQLDSRQINQKEAAKLLNLCDRQVRRLLSKYRKHGAIGIISGHRNKPSNNQLPGAVKSSAIGLIKANYSDFGPTLAAEYLSERHNIGISVETIRQLMVKEGLWKAKQTKSQRVYQQRERRSKFGELIQLDGSYHDWFEGRAEKCCLLVLIDDATSAIVALHFCHAESTNSYFQAVAKYFNSYGLPMSFYSDKHGVFRVNIKEANGGNGLTQFGRAMEQIGIELIHANTPQAKGRVERANSTLQDRLVKDMRLEGISSIDEANAYLPKFIDKYNDKFAKAPRCGANAHCELQLDNNELDHILSTHTKRILTKNLECSYNNVIYQIEPQGMKYRLQNKTVTICENHEGKISIYHGNDQLSYKTIDKKNQQQDIHDSKTLNSAINRVKAKSKTKHIPSADHPWRNNHKNKYKSTEVVA